jgi:hypothetical protein
MCAHGHRSMLLQLPYRAPDDAAAISGANDVSVKTYYVG